MIRLLAATMTASLVPAALAAGAPVTRVEAQRLAGQRIVWSFPGTAPPQWVESGIRRGEIGAILLFSSNGRDVATVRRLTRRLQAIRRPLLDPPLLIMSDHEGGPVRRIDGPPRRGAGDLATAPVAASRTAGREAGQLLCRAGVNVDLAPVVDLAHPGSVIGRQGRAFGRTPQAVADRAIAFAQGLEEYGIGYAPKHFPGLGRARETTDEVPVTITADATALRTDLRPFAQLVGHGAPMVMVGSAIYPAFDRQPAVLSARVVGGELRGRMGFSGIVVADALDTPALAAVGRHDQVALRAARADVDLMPFVGPDAARHAQRSLAAAITRGRLSLRAARASRERVFTYRRAREIAAPAYSVQGRPCG